MEHQEPIKSNVHPIFSEILCSWGVHEWTVQFVGKFTWFKCQHCPATRCE